MNLFRACAAIAAAMIVVTAVPALAAVESGVAVPAFVIGAGSTRVTLRGATRLTLDCDLRNYYKFVPSAGSVVIVNGYRSPLLLGVDQFADLTIASHGVAGLATDATVNGTLTLTSGWLSVAAHELTANAISGGSAASYVITPDTLSRLVRAVNGSTNTRFPVGNAAYNPVSVRTGSGSDVFRIAAIDDPPATGMTAASALTRAWYVGFGNAPGTNGNITWSAQFNSDEVGASFDRSVGNASSAWAWRWNGAAWSPQAGVRRSDNSAYPAVDTLVSTLPGLWTMGGVGALLAAEGDAAPRSLELAPAWPNPFRGATSLRYGLPKKGRVTVGVYSVLGERVATLVDGEQEAGWHVARLEAGRMANGVYFLRVQAGGDVRSSKLVVMR